MARKKKVIQKSELAKSPPRFEDSLAELEKVVKDIESGSLPLSEAIQRYEAGVKLLKQCHDSLGLVQRKIELLTRVESDGKTVTVPFDDDGTPVARPASGKSNEEAHAGAHKFDSEQEGGEDVDEAGRLF